MLGPLFSGGQFFFLRLDTWTYLPASGVGTLFQYTLVKIACESGSQMGIQTIFFPWDKIWDEHLYFNTIFGSFPASSLVQNLSGHLFTQGLYIFSFITNCFLQLLPGTVQVSPTMEHLDLRLVKWAGCGHLKNHCSYKLQKQPFRPTPWIPWGLMCESEQDFWFFMPDGGSRWNLANECRPDFFRTKTSKSQNFCPIEKWRLTSSLLTYIQGSFQTWTIKNWTESLVQMSTVDWTKPMVKGVAERESWTGGGGGSSQRP